MAYIGPDDFPSDDELADAQPIEIEDERDDLPLFLHSELDDLPLTVNAFRVYAHLVRRVGRNGKAWPSYRSIGEHCLRTRYPKAKPPTIRRRAMEAVEELEAFGLITIQKRRAGTKNHTNYYRLTPKREWRKEAPE